MLFGHLNYVCPKFYNTFKHLAVDEVTVLFEGRIIFKQYIPIYSYAVV